MDSKDNKIPAKEELIKNYSADVKKKKSHYFHELKLLWTERNLEKLIEIGREAVDNLPQNPTGAGDKEISGIYLLYATALWELNKDKKVAMPYALKAAHFDRSCKNALWLIREINSDYSPSAKLWRIDVEGEYYLPVADGVSLEPFTTTYQVVADSEDEGMDYIRQFERPEIAGRIRIRETKIRKERTDDPKGVYTTAQLFAYNLDKDD